ncbi:hypothetical protein RJT34_15724 [Clitoria ternatea]|uniref:Uncharacterized protein n=1 Tax=Clitoria ternatea TaxID=43366 RepID=A0AAN9J8Y2_CLITE
MFHILLNIEIISVSSYFMFSILLLLQTVQCDHFPSAEAMVGLVLLHQHSHLNYQKEVNQGHVHGLLTLIYMNHYKQTQYFTSSLESDA